jgi:acylglycerol lipase
MSESGLQEKSGVMYRRWVVSDAKAVLLLVHGIGAHSARWDFLADFFGGKGFSCYAIELKGFGQTPDRPQGYINSFNTYYKDILTLREAAQKEHPGKKIFLIGESLGGLLAFTVAALHPEAFAGLVLMSPAFANAMPFRLIEYIKLPFFLIFNRKHLIEMPFTSAMCTRDLDYQRVMDNNPDECRYASINLIIYTLLTQFLSAARAKKFKLPVLFQVSGKDQMVSTPAARQTFKKIGSTDKTLIAYPDMWHALYIDLDREKVYADLVNWLGNRL